MEYKRLGDYIREVNVRNRDEKVTNLQGVSISKMFIHSIANTIGTDMSTYKIVKPGQFAYGPVTSRNGDKVSIALYEDSEDAIISQAYTVFDVIDKNEVSNKYLMMWFQRPEFDRYARFHSHGSAREIFDWDELCNVMLPLPSIERQREIVSEYETLSRRISLNEQMIQELEATAQTLYCKMFVDGIDKENLPEGWRMGNLSFLCDNTFGGDWGKDELCDNYIKEVYCVRGADIPYISVGKKNTMPTRYILSKNLNNKKLADGNIVIEISGGTPTQSTGRTFFAIQNILSALSKDVICSNFCRTIVSKEGFASFFHATLKKMYKAEVMFRYENSSNGINNLDLEALLSEETIIIPPKEIAISFSLDYRKIMEHIILLGREIEKVIELQSLLLAKMGNLKQ